MRLPFRTAWREVIGAMLAGWTISQGAILPAQDFDRAALERIVSGSDDAERGEARRQALIARQRALVDYLPWMSGIGPGSYYWGAPYFGPPYPGISASYSAGAFYGHAYKAGQASRAMAGQGALERFANANPDAANPAPVGPVAVQGFTVQQADGLSPPLPSTALYGPFGSGGVGIAGSVNPLFAGLPGWLNAFEPTPFIPGYLWGYPYVGAVEQPVGHRILSAGAKGYIYEPVYARDLISDDSTSSSPMAGQSPAATDSTPRRSSVASRQWLGDAVEAFQRQRYERALQSLDRLRGIVDPHYPAELLRGQALFALGRYDEASVALRRALAGLPDSEWGLIVANYRDYYLLDRPLELQLRELEDYVARNPDSAAARLLLGYQYGFLGYPDEAAEQLQFAAASAPGDPLVRRLWQGFANRADQERAPRGEPAMPQRAPAVPKPEGVDDGARDL